MQNDAQPVDERPPSEGGVSAQMRQDLALHFADQFRIGVERSNTLLGAWVSALMLILFASILPVAGKLDRIDASFRT